MLYHLTIKDEWLEEITWYIIPKSSNCIPNTNNSNFSCLDSSCIQESFCPSDLISQGFVGGTEYGLRNQCQALANSLETIPDIIDQVILSGFCVQFPEYSTSIECTANNGTWRLDNHRQTWSISIPEYFEGYLVIWDKFGDGLYSDVDGLQGFFSLQKLEHIGKYKVEWSDSNNPVYPTEWSSNCHISNGGGTGSLIVTSLEL